VRYFFLSHAHTNDPHRLVADVFDDLSERIRLATGAGRNAVVGAVARCDNLTGAAGETVGRELARCNLLVPLYSPRYFASPECGRVISAFCQREPVATRGTPPILPLLWVPTRRSWPPVPALPVDVPNVERYSRHGLFDLMTSRGEADADFEYETVLDELARHIVATAEHVTLPIDLAIDPRYLPNAFARPASPPRVSIHVLAPDLGRLPLGRDPNQYGTTATHWSPYPEAPEGLGARVASMARHIDYRPSLAPVDDVELDVCGHDSQAGPAILLLDPWALEQAKWRDQLEEFDRQDRPWVTVLAAWNLDDPQTSRARRHLLDQLHATLRRRYHQRRPGLQLDVDIATSLLDVGGALPPALQESSQQFGRWRNQRREL
jgi:FxsC-like protein